MIENPQPTWLPLLLLALPGILFASCALNETVFPRENRPLCTIPAIGMVLALLPTHVLALALGSLSVGLTLAWSMVGVVGYAWIIRHWPRIRFSVSIDGSDTARKLGIGALSAIPIILPTILLNFHDEAYFTEHHAIIAHLQNGTYPPRYLYEPTLPLRYHYGFDLAAAIVTGLLRIRVDHAIDLLTLALWPCMFLLLWRVGEHFGGRRAGIFVVLVVCFAGGLPALVQIGSACPRCSVSGLEFNPPFISYFFQHPWSIGVPIFCLVVLQRAALPRIRSQPIGLGALVCSLSLLSLCQGVLFVTTVAALSLTEAWSFVWSRGRRHAVIVLLGVGISSICAKLIGGFFVTAPFPPAGGLLGTGFHVRDFSAPNAALGLVQWDFATFGALLVLGTVGLLCVKRDKLFLTILAVLTLVIVNSLRYEYTWDIVKFGTVSFIVLGIGSGVILSDLAARPGIWVRRTVCVFFVPVLLWQGVSYLLAELSAYDPETRPHFSIQMIRPYFSSAYPVNPDDGRAVSFLRTHIGPSEIVYRTAERSEPYAIWGGLPTQASVSPADTGDNDPFGLGQQKFSARKDLANISDTWLDRLSAEHVAWVVTDSDDVAINAVLDGPEAGGRAVLAAQYGNVRVFRTH
jgi:hypothetical protein